MSAFLRRYCRYHDQTRHDLQVAKQMRLRDANQLAILKALADGDQHDYHEIVQATGIYSNLPGELRHRNQGSLTARGLVRELSTSRKGATFILAPRGRDLLNRLGVDCSPPRRPFAERQRLRLERMGRCLTAVLGHGLTYGLYVLLKALADGDEHDYREIAQASGVYSGLPTWLRYHHDGSLGQRGLVREDIVLVGHRKVWVFQLTAKGKALLDKIEKARAEPAA
jgi:hypothetical protein